MKKYIAIAAVLFGTAPVAYAQMPQPPKTVQTIMQSIGGDWAAMENSRNHVVAGLQELQTYAMKLETENATLKRENEELKRKNEEFKKEKDVKAPAKK